MPKQSEKLRMEREIKQASLKTAPREKRPFENYLSHVKDLNKKRTERVQSRESGTRQLSGVASLPSLQQNRGLQLDQKPIQSPASGKSGSRNHLRVRHTTPKKAHTA